MFLMLEKNKGKSIAIILDNVFAFIDWAKLFEVLFKRVFVFLISKVFHEDLVLSFDLLGYWELVTKNLFNRLSRVS
jgi:hypothetical protein